MGSGKPVCTLWWYYLFLKSIKITNPHAKVTITASKKQATTVTYGGLPILIKTHYEVKPSFLVSLPSLPQMTPSIWMG